jgi:hypothetical protein
MRAIVVTVAVLVVVGAGAPLVSASGGGSPVADSGSASTPATFDTPDNGTENDSENASMPAGARLAGVVNVQAAEVEGEVQERSFGVQMAAARSNASKASVVASQVGELNETLAELQDRKRSLVEAKQNGSISQARFRAEMAGLAAEISTARRLSNTTAESAEGIPAPDLEAGGVNVTAIQRLQTSASNLSGPEVASIARDVGGVSGNSSEGPPSGLGNDDRPGAGDVPGGAAGNNVTVGPDGNQSVGPDGNLTVSPDANATAGPDGKNDVTPNETVVPKSTAVVNGTSVDPAVNATDDDISQVAPPSDVPGASSANATNEYGIWFGTA